MELVHFISVWEAGEGIQAHTFDPASCPDGVRIARELMAFCKRDALDNDDKGYPRLHFSRVLDWIQFMIAPVRKVPQWEQDILEAAEKLVPDTLSDVENWGHWHISKNFTASTLFTGKTMFYDSWC